jgi:hypothetical protein
LFLFCFVFLINERFGDSQASLVRLQRHQELAVLKEGWNAEEHEGAANKCRKKEEQTTRRAEERRRTAIRMAEESLDARQNPSVWKSFVEEEKKT